MSPTAPLFDLELDGSSKLKGRRSPGDPPWCLVLGVAATLSWVVPRLGLLIASAGLASSSRAVFYSNTQRPGSPSTFRRSPSP